MKPDATFAVASARAIGVTASGVWALGADGTLVSIDAKAGTAADPIALDPACGSLAADFGAVWVPLCDAKTLARVDLETRAVTKTPLSALASGGGRVAAGVGSLWVLADDRGTLLRLDPETGKPVADIYAPKGASDVAFGLKSLWVTSPATNAVIRVNPYTNLIEKTIPAGTRPDALAIGDDAVWVLGENGRAVVRLDPASNRETARIEITGAEGAGHIAAGEGSVWVSLPGVPLVRIDPRTNQVGDLLGEIVDAPAHDLQREIDRKLEQLLEPVERGLHVAVGGHLIDLAWPAGRPRTVCARPDPACRFRPPCRRAW